MTRYITQSTHVSRWRHPATRLKLSCPSMRTILYPMTRRVTNITHVTFRRRRMGMRIILTGETISSMGWPILLLLRTVLKPVIAIDATDLAYICIGCTLLRTFLDPVFAAYTAYFASLFSVCVFQNLVLIRSGKTNGRNITYICIRGAFLRTILNPMITSCFANIACIRISWRTDWNYI
jgi:hypothetical protein